MRPTSARRRTRSTALAAAALALAVSLTGCTNAATGIAGQYEQGTNKGYISGDGSVQEIPAAERGAALEFTGTAVDGSTVTAGDFAGDVVVLNFWYAGCGPCRVEAPILEEVNEATKDAGAHFLGVNIYDGPEQATSFEETYGITYPSLLAREDAALKLSFASWVSLTSVPTTLVLDREGRVSARIIGAVQSESVLRTLVDDVLAETS